MIEPVVLKIVSPFDADVLELIRLLNEHNLSHYPPETCHLDPPEVLARDNCVMIGAYNGPSLCGIGAVKLFTDFGEIKRMFVPLAFRGFGVSKLILERLMGIMVDRGVRLARLETGYKHTAAINLYRKFGFRECDRFGSYAANAHSVFMEKTIAP